MMASVERSLQRRSSRLVGPRAIAAIVAAVAAWAAGCEEQKSRENSEEHGPAGGSQGVVVLAAEGRARAGIEVVTLQAARFRPSRTAYGRVLSPDSLVDLHREIAAAEATIAASRADHERNRALMDAGDGTSRKALEASEAQFRVDEIRLRDAFRRLAVAWSDGVAGLAPAEREVLVEGVVAGRSALCIVALPAGEALVGPPEAVFVELPGRAQARASVLGRAPRSESGLQGDGFVLRVDGIPSLRPGATVTARIEVGGDELEGVVVPAGAIVWHEGRAWAWVREDEERFVRKEVPRDRSVEGGWFAREGFRSGDDVVVKGAQVLLSTELSPTIILEED